MAKAKLGKKWQIERMAEPKRIFNKIKEQPRPNAVVIFGDDEEHKTIVTETFGKHLPRHVRAYISKDEPRVDIATALIRDGSDVLVILSGDYSHHWVRRHETIEALKDAGAASIVGVHAKGGNDSITPTPNGIDYLITVRDDD